MAAFHACTASTSQNTEDPFVHYEPNCRGRRARCKNRSCSRCGDSKAKVWRRDPAGAVLCNKLSCKTLCVVGGREPPFLIDAACGRAVPGNRHLLAPPYPYPTALLCPTKAGARHCRPREMSPHLHHLQNNRILDAVVPKLILSTSTQYALCVLSLHKHTDAFIRSTSRINSKPLASSTSHPAHLKRFRSIPIMYVISILSQIHGIEAGCIKDGRPRAFPTDLDRMRLE